MERGHEPLCLKVTSLLIEVNSLSKIELLDFLGRMHEIWLSNLLSIFLSPKIIRHLLLASQRRDRPCVHLNFRNDKQETSKV